MKRLIFAAVAATFLLASVTSQIGPNIPSAINVLPGEGATPTPIKWFAYPDCVGCDFHWKVDCLYGLTADGGPFTANSGSWRGLYPSWDPVIGLTETTILATVEPEFASNGSCDLDADNICVTKEACSGFVIVRFSETNMFSEYRETRRGVFIQWPTGAPYQVPGTNGLSSTRWPNPETESVSFLLGGTGDKYLEPWVCGSLMFQTVDIERRIYSGSPPTPGAWEHLLTITVQIECDFCDPAEEK